MPVLLLAAALTGLAVGSFLNVVIHRVPLGQSVVHPPSHCPACGHAVRARHNIPVVGWLALRGRCADCRTRIPLRYPAVELSTALLFVAVTARLGALDRLPAVPAYLAFTAAGVALSLIDLDCRRLPDAIVLPAYPVLGLLLMGAAAAAHDGPAALRALVGGVALYAVYLALALAYPAGMGFGDVKLSGLVGAVTAFISVPALLVGAFSAFLLGGLAGAVVLVLRRGTRRTALPFGPFMVTGALVGVFAGGPIGALYLHMAFGQ